jgi:hypothetical protein
MTEQPHFESLGLLTALALTVWLIAQRHAGSWAKPLTWLVQGGLKAWLDKEVFDPLRTADAQAADKIKHLESENSRLIGVIEGLTLRVSDHEERLRVAETSDIQLTVDLRDAREEIALLRSSHGMISQTLVDMAEGLATLNANREADLLTHGMLTQDLRQVNQNIHTLMINLIK